jgi:nucleoside-diphosphate-sugar epimerase
MKVKRMRTLVLGGSVFVGRHLVEELLRRGHEVTVLNRGLTPAEHLAAVQRLTCDRKDHDAVRRALDNAYFDAAFDVSGYVPEDVAIMVDVLRDRVEHYVFTSTVAVYARSDYAPIDEEFDLDRRPQANPYTAGKVRCEDILMAAHRDHGFPVTIIRPSYVYGPHNPLTMRELSFFLRLQQGRKIIVPGNGSVLIQNGHVDDLARAFAAVLGKREAVGQAYNVTAEKAVTALGYVKALARIVGREADIVFVDLERMQAMKVPVWPYAWRESLVFTIEKAKRDLGWAPGFDCETGHRQTYDWFQREGMAEMPQYDFSAEEQALTELGA